MSNQTWKFKGSAGQFQVWHAGKNLYYVVGPDAEVWRQADQFGIAWSYANKQYQVAISQQHYASGKKGDTLEA